MKLNEWVDSHKLNEYIAEGLVTMRNHPKHPLVILNYSPAAQSVKNWDLTLISLPGACIPPGYGTDICHTLSQVLEL